MQILGLIEVPNWLVYTTLGTVAFYIYGMWPYSYWKKRGINGPRMLPLIGDLPSFMRLGFHGKMVEDFKLYGKVHGTYTLRSPVLVIGDTEMIKQVCIKRAENFTDRGSLGNETKPLDKGIAVLKGHEWKRIRSILSPTFSSGKIKAMFPLVEQCSDQLCNALVKSSNESVDIKTFFTNFTMDVVASTLFGLQINTQDDPNNDFKRHGSELFNIKLFSWKFLSLMLFPKIAIPLFKRFEITLFPKESFDFFQKVIHDALVEREASADSDKYHDFLASMVVARREAEKEGAKGLTEHEVMAQSLTFFLAGFETTANAMQYLAYFLAWNKDCQDRAYREVLEAKANHGGQVNYECLKSLRYLNNCFEESMRLCPPALLTDRVCTETTTVNGYEIEKGINVRIPIYCLAHDPEVWEEPERFNPDRFDEDSAESRDPTYLIPFGLGPRNCIGMRLAQMEVRKAMAEMLLKVEFQTLPETLPFEKLEFKPSGFLTVKSPIKLKVVPRSSESSD
ncbi:hypothetical protein BOX15_Mlig028940g3 [Macrostomum lignano]|uniref:Cytochrome P450 n=1 Tax=Macrostomum lignano TaxID=282301 RepID=A0A267FWI0_9PLAT|nr:hypothetical protein BOX15_Mlig028940g3 [Macrostomum lignano]